MMPRLFSAVFVLILVGSACASGSDSETSVAVANDSESSTGPEDAPTDSTVESDDEQDGDNSEDSGSDGESESGDTAMAASSPIGAFFADDGGFEAALAEYTVRVEEAIVVCMAAQGFEFIRTSNRVNEVDELQNELTIREWTTEFGFGISTSFDSVAENQATDPNADILFSLSAGEREIWVQTLTGGELGAVNDGDFTSTPLEEQGCIGQALIETGGQEAIEGIDTFGTAYEEGEEALNDRRDMVDAVAEWARCMSESGFPGYGELDAPEESIGDRYQEVIAPMSAALDNLTPEEGQALVSGESLDLADLPDLDIDALRKLQADEIALALADLDCYELEVQAIYEPLRDEFEIGLLTEYAAEFDALKNIGS